ncbi:Zinc finger, C2H2 type [Nesidiocoris tenuis]|uniref:Zinc finger, C2H2 type n=1 Tax=Nesidiocoris tenuis TaxID=355587 RepID=A0ABN7BH38_9HEMI|nr:Zinc finger, C2H2 type [Nesidiocoris tenuis]
MQAEEKPPSKTKGAKVPHVCAECGKSFDASFKLKKHMRAHTGEKPYTCQECGLSYSQSGGLRNHIVIVHRNEKVFQCHYCGKGFPIKDRLKLHLRIHTGEKPYSCQHCSKSFARGSQLTQHLRTHTKDRPYTCPQCNSNFVCRNNLLHHIKRHQGERDYVCHKCGKTFIRRDSLQKHLAWFHANLKAFECKICNKRYKGHLLQHMRIHRAEKPHKCSWCEMRFVQRSQLTVHERTHSGIRPYRCAVCHMAFAHSTALKMHIRRHTGEKPFKCLICPDRAFSQLPHLKKHMLSIHKTNRPYYCVTCKDFFLTKVQLEEHLEACSPGVKQEEGEEENAVMPVGRMRLLLAILLQKISTPEKLEKLRFGKRLIDDVLVESIEQSGRTPCKDASLTESERLSENVKILLEWTVPKEHMDKFKQERRSMEELLDEFTNLFIYE